MGLIPVNRGFTSPDVGVTIFVYSGAVHSDVILPAKNDTMDWRKYFPATDFKADPQRLDHIAIGWGDRGFFLETPYWTDLKLSTAAKAILIPSCTVMHVDYMTPVESHECKPVVISAAQYERLVEFILASFATSQREEPIRIGKPYGLLDAFYEAKGRYHAFNTCNCWVGNALEHAGVKVGWFTPFPRTVLWHLPRKLPTAKAAL
jgi:uncharacterized protein (TIGR02117 family)